MLKISSVVVNFDLSQVEVYGWSKVPAERVASSDVLFQFPSWFKRSMGYIVFFSGSIPSLLPITSQEAIECLADRYAGDPGAATDMPSRGKVLYAAIWWLCFPLGASLGNGAPFISLLRNTFFRAS